MSWESVGKWIKENAGTGTKLVGSLLTGNVTGAMAAGISLVSGATGTDDPAQALATLQNAPQTMVKLKELYYQNEANVRQHLETMTRLELEDQQKEHETTQLTIRNGDSSNDEYVRRTRPKMARESWIATCAYCLLCLLYRAFSPENADIFDVYLAGVLSAPAAAYIGLRTGDKFAQALAVRKDAKNRLPSSAA